MERSSNFPQITQLLRDRIPSQVSLTADAHTLGGIVSLGVQPPLTPKRESNPEGKVQTVES